MILMIRGLSSFQGEIILIPPLLRKDGAPGMTGVEE
jgi:hypothetical protein